MADMKILYSQYVQHLYGIQSPAVGTVHIYSYLECLK